MSFQVYVCSTFSKSFPGQGIRLDLNRMKVLTDMLSHKSRKKLQVSLGLLNYLGKISQAMA